MVTPRTCARKVPGHHLFDLNLQFAFMCCSDHLDGSGWLCLQVVCVLLALVTSEDVTPGATSLDPDDPGFVAKLGRSPAGWF